MCVARARVLRLRLLRRDVAAFLAAKEEERAPGQATPGEAGAVAGEALPARAPANDNRPASQEVSRFNKHGLHVM